MYSDHNENVPKLISLINAFLHFQTSPHLQTNLIYTTYLHAVVSHFAMMGPIAR